MSDTQQDRQHAALWLIGPDMPGLLRLGSKFVADRGGNIDKDIADKFGEKAVVFMSLTASPEGIARMREDIEMLKKDSRCGVVFQPMKEPTIPPGYQPDLQGFDLVTDDAPGLIVELTSLAHAFGMMIVGHTGERRAVPGPGNRTEAGQKFVLMLPHEFDHYEFAAQLSVLARKHHGKVVTPLKVVPGLLWWW